jgi:hypothetical protein
MNSISSPELLTPPKPSQPRRHQPRQRRSPPQQRLGRKTPLGCPMSIVKADAEPSKSGHCNTVRPADAVIHSTGCMRLVSHHNPFGGGQGRRLFRWDGGTRRNRTGLLSMGMMRITMAMETSYEQSHRPHRARSVYQ